MAIQFPNFLAAQTANPDYSGIGNAFENYYAGKAMPKDDLIKAVQAEFARPTAEQALLSSKLSNRKSQLDINKLVMEAQQQKELEDQLRRALGGGGSPAQAQPQAMTPSQSPSPSAAGMPPLMSGGAPAQSPAMPAGNPVSQAITQAIQGGGAGGAQPSYTTNLQDTGTDVSKMDPRYRKFDQMASAPAAPNAPDQGAIAPTAPAPQQQPPQEDNLHEIVVAKGAPQLAGIDAMYDSNPLSRAFLEKKGYKKVQEVKFDNKTGRTTIITKYPSGKVTVQGTASTASEGEGVPLTNKMVSKHQGIISAVDNASPIIQQILDLDDKKSWEPYPRNSGYQPGLGWVPGYQSKSTNYEALVSSALDSLIGAYGLPSTNEAVETVKKQLLIGHGETDKAYKKRLKNLLEDLNRRKNYSASEIKRTNKISPIDSSAGGATSDDGTYSSDQWEVT